MVMRMKKEEQEELMDDQYKQVINWKKEEVLPDWHQ